MNYKCVGVIGAGTMGTAVSINLALNNIFVILIDVSLEMLEKAKGEIKDGARFATFMKKNKDNMSVSDIMSKITFSINIEDVYDCDFIIENVTEKFEIKREIYTRLDKICKDEVCFAANTSCISITKLGSLVNNPKKVIGIHFMNPVYLKSTVEVVKGIHTSDETIVAADTLLKQLGKDKIVVNDSPGFVSNRISHLFMNEAAFVVQDQVAAPKQVDEIFKKCYGHNMGPLETADLIGLDTVVHTLDALYESYKDPKYRCCSLLRKLVDAGFLGRKTKKGFYEYSK